MALFMRCLSATALLLASQLVPACGSDCGEGTVRQGDNCVPESFRCGAGATLSDGVCVAVVDSCGPGTVLDGAQCVAAADGDGVCAEGTQFDEASRRCVSTVPGGCGADTILIDDDTCVVAGRIQLIHTEDSPAAGVIDVYIDDVLAVKELAYRTATPFFAVPAGAHTLAIGLPVLGSAVGDPIPETGTVDASFTANPVTDTVVVLYGRDDTATFDVATRTLPRSVDASSVALSFVNAAADGPTTVDLEDEGADRTSEADDVIVASGVTFGSASAVATVDATRGAFEVSPADRFYRFVWDDIGGTAVTLVFSGWDTVPDGGQALGLTVFSRLGGAGTELTSLTGP